MRVNEISRMALRREPVCDTSVPRLETFLYPGFEELLAPRFNLESKRKNYPHFLDDLRPWSNISAAAQLVRIWRMNGMAPGASPLDTQVAFEYGRAEEFAFSRGALCHPDLLTGLLRHWCLNGVLETHLAGFVSVDPAHLEALQVSVSLLGGVLLGVALPLTAAHQWEGGLPWTRTWLPIGVGSPASWGRHTVALIGYGQDGFVAPAWGELQSIHRQWIAAYAEEALVPVLPSRLDFLDGLHSPVNVIALRKVLAAQQAALASSPPSHA